MNKKEFVEDIALRCDISKNTADKVVKAIEDIVVSELKKGGQVNLMGFGTFAVAERAARKGLNPQTKEQIEIPARKVPVFKAAKSFKDEIA